MFYELSQRKKEILKAIIDAHINNGEPVGSKFLTQYSKFLLSSATIRNEMSELEEMGYLEQPHTSSGRIPSELGYRFYVDSLMQSYDLTQKEIDELNSRLRTKTAELDNILQSAGKAMSALTNYTSIAVKPKPVKNSVTHFSVMPVEPFCFLLVTIMGDNLAKTKFIHTTAPVSAPALLKLEELLNKHVAQKDISTVTLPEILEMESQMGEYSRLISPIIKYIYDTVSAGDRGELRIDGVDRLLQFPEFTDVTRLRDVLRFIDRRDELLELVSKSGSDRINIYIGNENGFGPINGTSLVIKKIVSDGKTIGAIGVIGPYRMDYSRVISALQYLSDGITGILKPNDEYQSHGGNNGQ